MSLFEIMDRMDPYIRGHQIEVGARRYDKDIPEVLKSNAGVQKLLTRTYPKWRENPVQMERAGRWMRAIQLYYRSGLTGHQAAEEMNLSDKVFWDMIKRIRRAANGLRTDGSGRRKRREK
jgi:predicted DNA-binding protein (UPF0251 family)